MRTTRPWIVALALVGALSACDDYLSGPGLTDDPNKPSQASLDQLFHAMQLTQYAWHTGDIARHTSMWTQQMAGIGNQTTGRDQYDITEQDFSFWFSGIWLGGGLIDMRAIQQLAADRSDRLYAGIAKVWEAYLIGMAASFWGDFPYSEAVGENPTPPMDEQADIYAAVQTVLDAAIADLAAGGTGPGALDLAYGGNAARWTALAHTLKARFYMHWVEAQNSSGSAALAQTACAGNCVQKALAAGANGISAKANDFKSIHSGTPGEENLWYQFMFVQRQGQISAGKRLVDLMKSRNDPRLNQYFLAMSSGEIVGSPPAGAPSSLLSTTRGDAGFDQPMVTYAENQLILAEANQRLGNTAASLTNLNNARTSEGLSALSGLSGAALLQEIMLEKYVTLFQNPESWNDFKRTCIPSLTPARGSAVIGRLLYGDDERNANPNIPAPSAQPQRNDNDPAACPAA
jgi:hypothetical protein